MLSITRQDLIHKTTGELRALFQRIQELANATKRPSAAFNALQATLALIASELNSRSLIP